MTVLMTKTVREFAVENPTATRVFEKLGIDYCCGGNQSLEQACNRINLTVDEVLDALEMAEATARSAQQVRDWQKEPLGDLIAHIKIVHHSYTRDEIVRLTALLHKVCSVHGQKHPELFEIQAKFGELGRELTTHMMKEEMVLFPYIERMEEAVIQKEPVVPGPFGTVKNPVAMMEHEHDLAGNVLRVIRKASNEYVAPDDACVSYQTLYQALSTFEADLHQHIHLENNLLFPRAVVMEKGRGESSGAE